MPRFQQAEIHSLVNPSSGDMTGYRATITGLYPLFDTKDDFNDHVLREFNRVAHVSGWTGMMFSPYDDGFRYVGTGALLT